jgi:hypothetical protein
MYNKVLYLCVLIVFSLHRESLKLILATDPLPRWFYHSPAPTCRSRVFEQPHALWSPLPVTSSAPPSLAPDGLLHADGELKMWPLFSDRLRPQPDPRSLCHARRHLSVLPLAHTHILVDFRCWFRDLKWDDVVILDGGSKWDCSVANFT